MMSEEIFSKTELSIIKDYIIQAVNLAVKGRENGGVSPYIWINLTNKTSKVLFIFIE